MEASTKLKAAVDYYEQKLGKNFDRRPTSGMVGQRCLGFVEDSNGNFIRIVPEMKTEDDIGPGSYNPEKPRLSNKTVRISPNTKRMDYIMDNKLRIGPQSYVHNEKSTRYKHEMRAYDRNVKVEPFHSGNLGHESWLKDLENPPHIPKSRFPGKKFHEKRNSACFMNKTKREIFPATIDERGTKYKPYVKPEITDVADSVFKNQFRRTFDDPSTPVPAPNAYTLPETLGSGPKFDFSPAWKEPNLASDGKPFDPEPESPGPATYDLFSENMIMKKNIRKEPNPNSYYRVPKNGKSKKKDKRQRMVQSPAFASRVPRIQNLKVYDSPSPCSYNISDKHDDRIQIQIPNRRDRPQTSWARASLDDTPSPCQYDPKYYLPKMTDRGVLIKGNSERESFVPKQMDHRYAFHTPHSSLLKRTYNARVYYANVRNV